jgi:hypothetical protein
MKFSVKEWRRLYDKVQVLGTKLRDSRPSYGENEEYIPPKNFLTKEAQNGLEWQIYNLTELADRYLDQCDLKMPKPLWHYDKKDPKTWASHESFQYGELLTY